MATKGSIYHDVVEIPLTRGCVAFIDLVDKDLAASKWHANSNEPPYAVRTIRPDGHCSSVYLHRIILSRILGCPIPDGMQVDHINANTLDNRRVNLRLCTHSENQHNQNKRRSNTSGFKGVSWHKSGRAWQSQITVNGKQIYLGLFDTPEEAYAAYCDATAKYHGEFARTK